MKSNPPTFMRAGIASIKVIKMRWSSLNLRTNFKILATRKVLINLTEELIPETSTSPKIKSIQEVIMMPKSTKFQADLK